MKKIETVNAVGAILCHDITKIVKDGFKGVAFKKGHKIKEEDIQELLDIGKAHIYVWEAKEGYLHENDAAIRIKEFACGDGLVFSEIKEGKINFIAEHDGLLKIDVEKLYQLNMIDEIMMATLHNNTFIKKGQVVGGTRVIPLMIDEEKVKRAEEIGSIISVLPLNALNVGIVTTGSEVYHKRILDTFTPVVEKKLLAYSCNIIEKITVSDDIDGIKTAVETCLDKGCEMILCLGGMSVDPDDLTPAAIKGVCGDIVTYGSPVLPGAMFLLAYHNDVAIMGLPGCVMHSKITVFDLVLPRILSGEKLTKKDIALYGHGGFCLNCEVCTFPHCNFGKN